MYLILYFQHWGGRNRRTSELEASLVYIGNSRPTKATQRDALEEQQDKNSSTRCEEFPVTLVRTDSWLRGARLEKALFRLYLQCRNHEE